jgi:hypothetical protein
MNTHMGLDDQIDSRPPMLFWIRVTLQGAAAALVAYVGGSMIAMGAPSLAEVAGAAVEDYGAVLRSLFSRI